MSDSPYRKGVRVSFTVMYNDGLGHGRGHITTRTEYGRITRMWPPDAPSMARVAVEDPAPGATRYVTRKLRDLGLASGAMTEKEFDASHAWALKELISPEMGARLPRFESWRLQPVLANRALLHAAALGSARIGPIEITFDDRHGYHIASQEQETGDSQ